MDSFKNLITNPFLIQKYKIGEVINSKKNNYLFKIINFGVRVKDGKECIIYTCKCSHCGKIFQKEQRWLAHSGCPHCFNYDISIPQSAPWMVSYFQGGYDEAIKYCKTSRETIFPICPKCGKKQNKPYEIVSLYLGGLQCSCSTKTTLPERIILLILDKLGIEYIYQPSLKFLGFADSRKAYDFYLPKYSIIIETHGLQHYEDVPYWKISVDQKENDEYKKRIALENGIKKYIEIDCRNSNVEWIKKSIMESDLPSILMFSEDDIDWEVCKHTLPKSIVKDVCDDYRDKYMSVKELANKYGSGESTITGYLRIGAEEGWVVHNSKIHTALHPVEVLKNGEHVGYYKSINYIVENAEDLFSCKLNAKYIKKSIKNKTIYKDFEFKFVEDIPLRWDILQNKVS